jgi:hypothetical protein
MTDVDDRHTLEVLEVYRSVEVYAGQSPERIARAKAEIDAVIAMDGPRRLYGFACDPANAPEARLLGRNKCLASIEARQKKLIDVDRLVACTIGIARVESRLGRLIAWRHADDWPEAWKP